ncbi:MAG TPA: acyl-CoA dehydrogenase family protein [Longimicrobiales bacterium]|nr:acyl-CoA dehydrogenase family protein [Longimicrobiales bacterium]
MTATPEMLEIRGLARDFAAAELRPHAERWDADRALDDDVAAKIAELGFFGMLVPEERGGMGFGLPTYLTALEELAWGEPGAALLVAQSVLAADVLVRFGGSTHEHDVDALAAGEVLGCVAFAEPDSADGAGAPTNAVEHDGSWTLNGSSPWVTNGARAGVAVVLAQADGTPALFALTPDMGYTSGVPAATMGLRSVDVVPLDFNGVQAPADARLSWSGNDARAALDPLGCLSAAAIAVGISQAALDHAVHYANEREQFGQPIRSFEGIQFKLAEMATRTAAARCLIQRAAERPDDPAAAAMAKLAAGSCAMYVTTDAVQIFGGYGYMRDYPVEKLMRDAKAMEMLHGTSEMQRLRIAAALYAD